jgi:hypothetical protein
VALAIFAVESKRAYDPTTGLVIVRFEPKVFLRRAARIVTSDHSSQLAEWQAIETAYAINPKAALESASYGLPQLMGFNFGVTEHADARALLLAFQRSAREQVAGFSRLRRGQQAGRRGARAPLRRFRATLQRQRPRNSFTARR